MDGMLCKRAHLQVCIGASNRSWHDLHDESYWEDAKLVVATDAAVRESGAETACPLRTSCEVTDG